MTGGKGRPTLAAGSWILCGAVLLAYFNAFQGAFQFDDYNVIVDNPAVHSWDAWAADLGGIRPLLKATYTLNWRLGSDPFGFHLLNLIIHGANAILVFAFIHRLFRRGPEAATREAAPLWAFFAALLFAVHPLQTEAVTYVSGRSSSLMALFYLGSLLAYFRGRELGSWAWRGGISPGLFVLALLTKETALTLPFVLALWEATDPAPRDSRARLVLGPGMHWGLLVLFGLFLALHGRYTHLLAISFGTRSVADNLLSQVSAVGYLFSKWVWPVHLNIDPCLPVLHGWTGPVAAQAALLGGLLALGLWNLRRRPWLAFGVLWCFLQLLPTNSLVPRFDVVNERQLYLASAGLSLALVGGVGEIAGRWNRFRWTRPLWGALATALLLLTHVRNRDYRNEIALWESSVKVGPHNPRAHNNLGCAYAYAGQPAKARAAFETALRLDPAYACARANLAMADWNRDGQSPR